MIPTINKSTRVRRKSATAVEHILTNTFVGRTFKSGIFKSDMSCHYPVIFLVPSVNSSNKDELYM